MRLPVTIILWVFVLGLIGLVFLFIISIAVSILDVWR